ncbi:MAG: ABC transporter ATP-binding protein [Kiritimatiellia bacterium]|jgi:putative ABC transport system ATP-binding protein|nr:ABC transporter ATP-binding protein [Kiritimatiellia bacterium]MDP6847158.1 ABC transporter ATP-binding protein [Kiritimatiellia bacterium]
MTSQITTECPADPNEPVIELNGITKTYQMGSVEVRALDGVSTVFQKGDFWAIMGPSGSGKSTMLNVLGCLDRPTTGTYILDGRDVSNMNDDQLSLIRLRRVGFIFQSFNLIPQLTVQRNIELPLYYLDWSVKESRKRARELADMVGLGDRLNHRPTELSGGQRQRVAVARALANDPAVILADEPTGNLDTPTGKQIMALLEDLNTQGKTIVMVTHESHVAAYAGKHLHMLDGKISATEDHS